jgi:hypothetical protein
MRPEDIRLEGIGLSAKAPVVIYDSRLRKASESLASMLAPKIGVEQEALRDALLELGNAAVQQVWSCGRDRDSDPTCWKDPEKAMDP